MTYFYILEGKIGRLNSENIKDDTNVGMCTDGITSCNVIVLISLDKKRYVLIHADKTIGSDDIRRELDWVGENASRFILMRRESGYQSQSSQDTMNVVLGKKGKSSFNKIYMEDDQEVISIKHGSVGPEVSKSLPNDIQYHPEIIELYVKHQIEARFYSSLQSNDLIKKEKNRNQLFFDSGQWLDHSSNALSSAIDIILSTYNISSKSSPAYIFDALNRLAPNLEKGLILHPAAAIVVHFYLLFRHELSFEAFIRFTFDLFVKELKNLQVLTEEITDEIQRFITIKNFDEFHTLALQLGSNVNDGLSGSKGLRVLSYQTEVMLNASYILFKRFPGLSISNLQQSTADSKYELLSKTTATFFSSKSKEKNMQWKVHRDDNQVRYMLFNNGDSADSLVNFLKKKGLYTYRNRTPKGKEAVLVNLSK